MFWKVFDVVFVLMAIGVVVTQMIVPQFKGTRWFPIFDRSKREALSHLVDVEDQIDIAATNAAARKRERDLARIDRAK